MGVPPSTPIVLSVDGVSVISSVVEFAERCFATDVLAKSVSRVR